MASRPEATVSVRDIGVVKWILLIKSSWIPELSLTNLHGSCKSGVLYMYAQILVLAIWYVIGVNSSLLCCNLC